jgi:hypothetical protein
MAQKFDDAPYGISDIPDGYVGGLSWEELKVVAEMRFNQAAQPHDKLKAWLDDHQVYPKGAEADRRIMELDWFGMLGLMHEAKLWLDEKREADHPPHEGTH